MAEWREFGATNEPDTCLWCGKKLVHQSRLAETHPRADESWQDYWLRQDQIPRLRQERGGSYADGNFCGLRCGYLFGDRLADLGRRLRPEDGR